MTELDLLRQQFFESSPEDWVEEEDVLSMFGQARHLLLSLQIICPRTVEYRGAIFLRNFTFNQAKIDTFIGDKELTAEFLSRLEWEFNYVEIDFLFATAEGRFESYDADGVLAERLAEAWRAWLPHEAPPRRFRVEVLPPEATGDTYAVRFCAERT